MADTKVSALPPNPSFYSNVDPANDSIPIVDNANSTLKRINRNNLLGITSAPVGINDTQTLTSKTLTAPTISSPIFSGTFTGTYTLAGTPTFPSSVVMLTGTQTLVGKTLTSPTINAPTITNANITADAVSGFTTANSGTIYGLSITAGVPGANTIPTASLQNSSVTYPKLAAGATRLGFVNDAGSSVGGLTTSYVTYATITASSHGGACEAEFGCIIENAGSGGTQTFGVQILLDGTVVTPLPFTLTAPYASAEYPFLTFSYKVSSTPASGSHTWVLQFKAGNAAAVTLGNNYLKVAEVV